MSTATDPALQQLPLQALHEEMGARMVPFAGYSMPVQYSDGVKKEHLHTRAQAGLFDVSHMGQVLVRGADAAEQLETLMPANLVGLFPGSQTYSVLTNVHGGILDDLIVMRWSDDCFFLVVNAACKDADVEHLRHELPDCGIEVMPNQALLALQGPAAREVLKAVAPDAARLVFMSGCETELGGIAVHISCCGYTGEDGFEISVPAQQAETVARKLLEFDQVKPIGLAARDTLRLEAGLCLYGNDLTVHTTPVEASIAWCVAPARRVNGEREGGFPGADTVLEQMQDGADTKRVGLAVDGKAPIRDGAALFDENSVPVGGVTSGGYAPSVGAPIAMASIETGHAVLGTELRAEVRGKLLPVRVAKLPFVPQRYYRG